MGLILFGLGCLKPWRKWRWLWTMLGDVPGVAVEKAQLVVEKALMFLSISFTIYSEFQ